MNLTFIYVSVILLDFLFFVIPAFAQPAEYIESFRADIEVRADSTFTVKEDIVYVFPDERHGIFRCIPTTHQDPASSFIKERYIDIEILSVRIDDGPVPYTIDENAELCVKIGDPESTISGQHTYEITYIVSGAISFPDFGGAELYWNVTGNEWEIPMRSVIARVISPDPILLRERACYQGALGEAESCNQRVDETGAIIFSGQFFGPYEGLTIAQALDRSKIAYDIRERYKLLWLLSAVVLIVVIAGGIALYRYKTAFKTGNTIIPQYEPYPDVKPMYSGFLFDRRLDPRDITAGIVYLAKEGFIKIRKIDRKVLFFFDVDDYEMTLLRELTEATDRFERKLLNLVFDDSGEKGKKVTLHELKHNHSQQRENTLLLQALDKDLRKDLEDKGFFTSFAFSSLSGKIIVGMLIICGATLFVAVNALTIVPFVLVLIAFIVLATGRRTRKGYEALDHLKGFKDFLRVTDKERFLFHNAPQKSPEQFMEYLPHAIAFGVEKEWAKTFEGITIPNPEWYDSGSGMHGFNASSLTQSLGSFSSSLASSSGASASSGGGSSGGGSGGGGGGSW